MRGTGSAIALVAFAALGATAIIGCAGRASPASTRLSVTASAGPATSTLASAAGGSPELRVATRDATVMEVTLGSGPDSGKHTASSSSVTCTHGLAAPGDDAEDSFGNQFADDSSVGLSALDLIVPTTKQAAAAGTDEFMVSATIGKPSKKHVYRINTLPSSYGVGRAQGAGHLVLDDEGASGTVTVRGRAGDGTTLEAVVHCNLILDASGQPRQ